MPTKADDTVKKEVLYPDDLQGDTLELDPEERLNGALAFWDAEDDAEALPDGAQHGWWLPVDSAEYGQTWAAMPRALREALIDADLESGDIIEVTQAKRGPGDTDPWTFQVAVVASADPEASNEAINGP